MRLNVKKKYISALETRPVHFKEKKVTSKR